MEDHLEDPSGLGSWTVADLVAHLGRSLATLTALRPAPPGTMPLGFDRYIAAYPDAAPEIDAGTRQLAREIRTDLLLGVDRMVGEAFLALAELPEGICVANRGPIDREVFVTTRLVELVVHGDDLGRATGGDAPLLPEAVGVVADALAAAYRQRGGVRDVGSDPLEWVRRAAGRAADDDPTLPLL